MTTCAVGALERATDGLGRVMGASGGEMPQGST